ncbi:hypothetical protein KAJ89_02460 [Candidatus Parcubacteria bacterium]|nr:hypothetical protein [Candidatus Parcubacteria bacterium]
MLLKKLKLSKELIIKTLLFLSGMFLTALIVSMFVAINVIYFQYDKDGECINVDCMRPEYNCVMSIYKKEGKWREPTVINIQTKARSQSAPAEEYYEYDEPYSECNVGIPIRERINEEIITWSGISSGGIGLIIGIILINIRKKYLKKLIN